MSPHRAVLVELVRQQGWTCGAELGVDKGVLFNMLLMGCPALRLIGVDTGVVPKRLEHCQSIAADFPDRARLLVMTTHTASAQVADGSLDFVFIDADHSESAVADDIACWQPKVRPGGWLGGHDYNRHFPGVVRAVDRSFNGQRQTWPGSIWGVWR
jgi:predicted O-methyltransferase YrrM